MRIRIQIFSGSEREKNFVQQFFPQILQKLFMGNFLSKNDIIVKKTQMLVLTKERGGVLGYF